VTTSFELKPYPQKVTEFLQIGVHI